MTLSLLAGKCAIVTGASSGIGAATARVLAQNGASVFVTGRNVAKLEALYCINSNNSRPTTETIAGPAALTQAAAEAAAEAETSMSGGAEGAEGEEGGEGGGGGGGGGGGCGGIVGHYAVDLREADACKTVVEQAMEAFDGRQLTTLVNCAGVLQGGAFGSSDATLENLMTNLEGNLVHIWEMMQHATPHLRRRTTRSSSANNSGTLSLQKTKKKSAAAAAAATAATTTTTTTNLARNAIPVSSSIINVTSVNGKQAFAGTAAYCTAKAAADMLTRCASVDLASDGIRVNSVCPGVVVTELQRRGGLDDGQYEAFLERSTQVTHPLAAYRGAVGQAEEVGDLIAFLASDHAGFITGECIAMDGGRQNLGAR